MISIPSGGKRSEITICYFLLQTAMCNGSPMKCWLTYSSVVYSDATYTLGPKDAGLIKNGKG